MAINKTGHAPLSTLHDYWMLSGKFDTNSTSAPDGLEGDISTVVRDGTGTFTVTMKHWGNTLLFPSVSVVTAAGTQAYVKSQTLSTDGKLVIELRDATDAVADTNNEAVYVKIETGRSTLDYR